MPYNTISDIPIRGLSFLERNPRKITADQMHKLEQSLQNDPDFLMARPILVNKIGEKLQVYAGNQRVKAAKKLGWKSIPCHIEIDLSEEQMRSRIIKDNKSFGEWDWDILGNEFNPVELIECGFIPEELHLDAFSDSDIEEVEEKKQEEEKQKTCPNCGHHL